MNTSTIDLSHLDAVAHKHYCQIEQQGDRRIYTSRTLGGCHEIYCAIRNREESEAIEIRKGAGIQFKVLHPTPFSVWCK